MKKKILISLFDRTGNASRPYRQNGWTVIQVDIQLGTNVYDFDYRSLYEFNQDHIFAVIAMFPCDNYATSGAKHFKQKDRTGITAQSQRLLKRVKKIIDFFQSKNVLQFWQLENPRTRIHTLNPWLGSPVAMFNPCDFAGYDPVPDNSRYNKETWLFGNFKPMKKKYLKPLSKENPGWKDFGGKSIKTKNMRSITPLGFAYAFYYANQ